MLTIDRWKAKFGGQLKGANHPFQIGIGLKIARPNTGCKRGTRQRRRRDVRQHEVDRREWASAAFERVAVGARRQGRMEESATGSAAGVVGAYLVQNSLADLNDDSVLAQGRFAGRPSQLSVRTEGSGSTISRVTVAGHVDIAGDGRLRAAPRRSRAGQTQSASRAFFDFLSPPLR